MVVSDDWRGFKTLILASLYLCVYCVFVTDIIVIFNKIQRHKSFKRTLFIKTKTQSANVRGDPLYQATKRNLNNS